MKAKVKKVKIFAEPSLEVPELRYRRLFEAAPDGILILDASTGAITDVNPFLIDMLGYSRDEFIDKRLWEVGAFKDIQASKEAFRALQKNEYIRYKDLPLRTKDGHLIPVEFVSNVYQAGSEKVVQCYIRDITERKQAETALKKVVELQRLATVVSDSNDAVIMHDLDGKILAWNRGAQETYGYTEADALGKNVREIVAEPDRKSALTLIQKIKQGEIVKSFELRRIAKDGRVLDVWLTTTLLRDETGSPMAIATTERDITQRKQAEEKLAASEAELRTLFASMTDAVIVLDADGHYVKIAPTNPINLARLPDEMLGKTVHEILPKEQADYIVAKTREAIQTGRVVTGEYALQIGGKEIWFASNATRLSENTAFWVARDFTEYKQAEKTIHQHIAELETLYESGLALGQLLPPKQIAQKLIDLMGAKLDWHHIAIRIYHPEDETLELLAFKLPGARGTGVLREAEQRLKSMISKAGEGLSGWAVQHRQNVRVGQLSQDPRFVNVEPNIHSGMYIPLKVEDRVVGVVSIESEKPDAFSDADERLTITLANQAAIALENARLHEETLHHLKQLQALHTIDRTIAGSFDQSMMLDVLLTQTLSQLDAEAAAIFLNSTPSEGSFAIRRGPRVQYRSY